MVRKVKKVFNFYESIKIHILNIFLGSFIGSIIFSKLFLEEMKPFFLFFLIEFFPFLFILILLKILFKRLNFLLISAGYLLLYPVVYYVIVSFNALDFKQLLYSHLNFLASGGMHFISIILILLLELYFYLHKKDAEMKGY